jgi:hypothetical protein
VNQFNILDLVLHVDAGVIRSNPDYILPNLIIPISIMPHSRRGDLASPHQDRPESGMEIFNIVIKVSLTGESENARNNIVGYAKPEKLQWEISAQNRNIDFILLLDYYLLLQIEKIRESKDLYLKLDIKFQYIPNSNPEKFNRLIWILIRKRYLKVSGLSISFPHLTIRTCY